MTVTVTSKTQTIQNETANDGSIVNQMFTDCYGNDATLAAYINANMTLLGGNNSLSGTNSFSGAVTVTGTFNPSRSSDPTTPSSGVIWYNSTSKIFKGETQIASVAGATNASPIVITTDVAHNRATGDTVTIASVGGNTAANGDWTITVTGAKTFSLNTSTGNGAYTSGGTVSYAFRIATTTDIADTYPTGYHGSAVPAWASNTTITMAFIRERSSDDTGNITKATSTTLDVSASAGLNALDTGTVATSTWYYLYAVTDGSSTGLMASTVNEASSGSIANTHFAYTLKRQLPFAFRTDGSGNIAYFIIDSGWPDRPKVLAPQQNVLASGQATTWTSVSLATYVPPISRQAVMFDEVRPLIDIQGVSGSLSLREAGTSTTWYTWSYSASGNAPSAVETVPVSSAQAVEYITTTSQAGSWGVYLNVRGFVVTEVS